MVKAVTTRSGMRKTSTAKETKEPEPILDKGETSKTVMNHETTNNSCEKNPEDTSIKGNAVDRSFLQMHHEKITQQNSTRT